MHTEFVTMEQAFEIAKDLLNKGKGVTIYELPNGNYAVSTIEKLVEFIEKRRG